MNYETDEDEVQTVAKPLHKFYIGAEHIGSAIARGSNAPIVRATIGEAIEDARQTLLKDPRRNAVVIVEIIRIVRRKEPPVIIEEV